MKYLLILLLFSSCAMFRTQPMSQPAISGDDEAGGKIDWLVGDSIWQNIDTSRIIWTRIPYADTGYVKNDTLSANLLVSILEKPLAVQDQQFGDIYTVFTMRGYVVREPEEPITTSLQGTFRFYEVGASLPIYLDGSKRPLPKSVIVWNYKAIDK